MTDCSPGFRAEILRRMLAKIDVGDCWLWTARCTNGYGVIRVGSAPRFAHNIMWELLVGPTPVDLEPDHLCKVPACVNPDHIEFVTHEENVRRSAMGGDVQRRRRQRCREGHPFDMLVNRGRDRACSICRWAYSATERLDRQVQRDVESQLMVEAVLCEAG